METLEWFGVDSSEFMTTEWTKEGKVAIKKKAATAPDGFGHAQKITMDPGAVLFHCTGKSIRVGETLVSGAWLWADKPTVVSLEIGKHGGAAAHEGKPVLANLTKTPKYFEVSCHFQSAHPSARLLFRNRSTSKKIAFYAWKAKVSPEIAKRYIVHSSDFTASEWIKEGDITFEVNAAAAPEGGGSAQRVTMHPGSFLYQSTEKSIRSGDTLIAGVWLWAEKPTEISIEIGRHGGKADYEGRPKLVQLSTIPQYFEVMHKFSLAHPSARLLMRNRSNAVTSFYAWSTKITKKKAII